MGLQDKQCDNHRQNSANDYYRNCYCGLHCRPPRGDFSSTPSRLLLPECCPRTGWVSTPRCAMPTRGVVWNPQDSTLQAPLSTGAAAPWGLGKVARAGRGRPWGTRRRAEESPRGAGKGRRRAEAGLRGVPGGAEGEDRGGSLQHDSEGTLSLFLLDSFARSCIMARPHWGPP